MIAIDTSHILFLAILYGIGITSFFFYSSDNKPETFEGKTQEIPAVPGAKWVIKVSFYATMVITTLALLAPEISALLVIWDSEVLRILGSILAVVGISVFVAAKLSLGRNYSPCFKSYVPQFIIQKGIYRYIRHPIYTGNLLIFMGALFASGSFWQILVFSAMAFLYYKTVQLEEAHLQRYIATYSSYMKNSGRFIPKIIHRGQIDSSRLPELPFLNEQKPSESHSERNLESLQ